MCEPLKLGSSAKTKLAKGCPLEVMVFPAEPALNDIVEVPALNVPEVLVQLCWIPIAEAFELKVPPLMTTSTMLLMPKLLGLVSNVPEVTVKFCDPKMEMSAANVQLPEPLNTTDPGIFPANVLAVAELK